MVNPEHQPREISGCIKRTELDTVNQKMIVQFVRSCQVHCAPPTMVTAACTLSHRFKGGASERENNESSAVYLYLMKHGVSHITRVWSIGAYGMTRYVPKT